MAAPRPHCDREEARAENTHNGDGDEVVLVQAFHPSATTAAGSTLPDVSPAPGVLSDGEDAPPPTAPTDGAHAAPTCCTCLEPLLPSGVGRRAVVHWPGCRHAYHFACLARSRAQVHPPRCPLCRQATIELEKHFLASGGDVRVGVAEVANCPAQMRLGTWRERGRLSGKALARGKRASSWASVEGFQEGGEGDGGRGSQRLPGALPPPCGGGGLLPGQGGILVELACRGEE